MIVDQVAFNFGPLTWRRVTTAGPEVYRFVTEIRSSVSKQCYQAYFFLTTAGHGCEMSVQQA